MAEERIAVLDMDRDGAPEVSAEQHGAEDAGASKQHQQHASQLDGAEEGQVGALETELGRRFDASFVT